MRIAHWSSPDSYRGPTLPKFIRKPNYVSPKISSETPYIFLETPYISSETPYILLEAPYISSETPYISLETPYISSETPTIHLNKI